jgi:hypothetical protein
MLANSQGRGLIIWPIATKLFQSVMLQQRPRFTGGRKIGLGNSQFMGTTPTLPWDDGDRPPVLNYGIYDKPPIVADIIDINFALCELQVQPISKSVFKRPQKGVLGGQPAVVHALKVMPTEVFEIIGVSKDSTNSILPNCTMCLFRKDFDSGINIIYTYLGNTTSDASGNYYFAVNKGSQYRVTGENGSVVGMTINTLTGVLS